LIREASGHGAGVTLIVTGLIGEYVQETRAVPDFEPVDLIGPMPIWENYLRLVDSVRKRRRLQVLSRDDASFSGEVATIHQTALFL
jgi:hypothetical protein